MRISDWSSDVCSSDLLQPRRGGDADQRHAPRTEAWDEALTRRQRPGMQTRALRRPFPCTVRTATLLQERPFDNRLQPASSCFAPPPAKAGGGWEGVPTVRADPKDTPPRSEEHTSELQSLMRTSYAVFCLKK